MSAPHFTLQDIADWDDRLEAHIDGLMIAGEAGWETCKAALAIQEPGEVFAAAVLAFDKGEKERIEAVFEAIGDDPELARSVISALGWLPYERVERWISRLLSSDTPMQRYIGIRASIVHRVDPGKALINALQDEDAQVKSAAVRTVGELGRNDLMPQLHRMMETEDSDTRFWIAWSAALLGVDTYLSVFKAPIVNKAPQSDRATNILFRRLSCEQSRVALSQLSQDAEQFRTVLLAAGVSGDPYFIPLIINAMNTDEVARVAGEAFSMITGVDIAYEDLEGEWPEGFEAGPTENPEDEDVALDPDEDLPWPEPELITQWWQTNKARFTGGARYLCGEQISQQQCIKVLQQGFQRQRTAAALELALMQKETPLFEVRAPGRRQKQALQLK